MILTRKRLLLDIFLTPSLSKSLAFCKFVSVNFEPWYQAKSTFLQGTGYRIVQTKTLLVRVWILSKTTHYSCKSLASKTLTDINYHGSSILHLVINHKFADCIKAFIFIFKSFPVWMRKCH